MMNNDEPICGPECMYDLRRLAHLAVKWVVISSFDSAESPQLFFRFECQSNCHSVLVLVS